MDDLDWLTLNAYQEARGEGRDGMAAVVRVTLNRARLRFFSDGTPAGAVRAKDQFSWLWFDMVGGRYTRVCSTPEAAQTRAEQFFSEGQEAKGPAGKAWAACRQVSQQVLAGDYEGGPDYQRLTPATVMYYNPAAVPEAPAWADPALLDARIGHHLFYHTPVSAQRAAALKGDPHEPS